MAGAYKLIQDTGYRIQDTGYKMREAGLGYWLQELNAGS